MISVLYRDMWEKRSHLLSPLTALTSNKVNFKWTAVEQKVFNEIKRNVACDIILAYPDFNKHFDIHTYDSDFRIGEVISKDYKIIASCSCKLTVPQTGYTVTED